MKVKYVLSNDEELSKRTFECDVPADMYSLRKQMDKSVLIGIGRWKNTNEIYIAIVSKRIIFVSDKLLKNIIKFKEKC